MIDLEQAQELMTKYVQFREAYNNTKDPIIYKQMKQHERICIDKFKYLVTMKTNRYKTFSNYDDLNQDGLEALIKSMKNYNPEKGIFFFGGYTNI